LIERHAAELATRLGVELAPQQAVASAAQPTQPDAVGEKMVSILFADVRGYAAFTREKAPADMADRIATLQRWAAQEVGRRGGIVDKFAGDAVMATFNVSGQSVDHALEALQTAIAIRDKAALMELPIGAGIAVGPAIVGRLTESGNVSVLGETTNLASRLQGGAGSGEVVLSDEAYRRVREWVEDRSLSTDQVTLELKGFEQPVSAHVVRARRQVEQPVGS
jgi:adenylate cyclase